MHRAQSPKLRLGVWLHFTVRICARHTLCHQTRGTLLCTETVQNIVAYKENLFCRLVAGQPGGQISALRCGARGLRGRFSSSSMSSVINVTPAIWPYLPCDLKWCINCDSSLSLSHALLGSIIYGYKSQPF